MDFTDVFSKSSLEEWQHKITKDLKGGSLEDLIWQSELGPIDPVLFDYQNKYERVDAHQKQEDNAWEITQSFDCSNPISANQLILDGLKGGINCLILLNLKSENLRQVLKDVMVNIISIKIYHEIEDQQAFEASISEYDQHQITLLVDPIGCYIGGHISEVKNIASSCIVRSSIFENAGASIQSQLGMSISMAHDYLLQLIASGKSGIEAAAMIHFEISIGNSYFAEIAKIRALRTLWNTVLEQYDIDFKDVNVHAVTSSFYQSNLDVHNNLLRGTTAAMAGIIAGVSSIELLSYDSQLPQKQSDGYRLSKNISLLLQEEAYFGQVKNAANGAYYIEQLTDVIIEKSWNTFRSIEEVGGFLSAFESRMIQATIKSDLQRKIDLFKNEQLVLVGTNKQPNKEEKNSESYANPEEGNYIRPYRLAQIKLS